MFEDTRHASYGSWVGTEVRHNGVYGNVIRDMNGRFRILRCQMDNDTIQEIVLNNMGKDDPRIHEWEWFCIDSPSRGTDSWYRF